MKISFGAYLALVLVWSMPDPRDVGSRLVRAALLTGVATAVSDA
jgi:hypothetical protein